MATGHVDDDIPNSLQLEVLDQEICLLQSAAVWHVLAVRSVSRLGEKPLDYVFMCARRGACMLRAGVKVISEVVYRETFAWAPNDDKWILFVKRQMAKP